MTLVDHLLALRRRLVRSALALLAAVVVSFLLFDRIFGLLAHPYCQLPDHLRSGGEGCQLVFFGVLDAFVIRLRVSVISGVILASPVWLYQLWAFITPGLHPRERRWALPFVASSVLLFAAGATFAYLTLGRGLEFLLGFGTDEITPFLAVDRYLSFVTLMLIAFGVSFEFPLLLIFLELVGLVDAPKLQRWRRGMFFGLAAFAALITPSQDPFTFLAMWLPLCAFYEVAILFARLHGAARRRRGDTSPYAGIGDDETSSLAEPPFG